MPKAILPLASWGSASMYTLPGALGNRDQGAGVLTPAQGPSVTPCKSSGAPSPGNCPVCNRTRSPRTPGWWVSPHVDNGFGSHWFWGGALIVRISVYTVTKNATTVITQQRQASRITNYGQYRERKAAGRSSGGWLGGTRQSQWPPSPPARTPAAGCQCSWGPPGHP